MTGLEWFVLTSGIGAIALINWYFFVAPARAVVAIATGGAASEITITVDGGYNPPHVRVPAGRPVRLIFDRRDTGSCSEEVVFPDFGIRKYLPTGQKTVVEVTPPAAGRYSFMCGMSMLRGTVEAV